MSPHTDPGALLPCPFCGSSSVDPEGWMSCESDGSDKRTGPACDDCGASATSDERWNTRDWAPEADNTRQAASHGSAGGEIERCAKIADAESDSWIKGEATTAVGQSFQRACRQIALKIRALSHPSTGGDADTSLQNPQTSPTEQEFLEDNIATVAFHLGQPGARLSVSSGLVVDPGEVLKEISRRLTAPAQASPKPEDLWECSGCGTRKSMEQIKAEHPNARSCCPERKMGPAIPSASIPAQAGQVPEMRERAAKVAEGALICHSCGYVGAFAECCDRMNFDGASTSEIAAAIRALPLDGPSVPSAHCTCGADDGDPLDHHDISCPVAILADRDWVEDAPHENGNYQCKCCECGQMFIGHKRRVLCKLCSNLLTPSVPSTHQPGGGK